MRGGARGKVEFSVLELRGQSWGGQMKKKWVEGEEF